MLLALILFFLRNQPQQVKIKAILTVCLQKLLNMSTLSKTIDFSFTKEACVKSKNELEDLKIKNKVLQESIDKFKSDNLVCEQKLAELNKVTTVQQNVTKV